MSGARLSTEMIERDGIPVVRVCGEIDLRTASEFERVLEAGIERGTAALIVDLTDVPYLDSAGLSALLAAHKSLSARNAVLYVVAAPGRPGLRRVLEITRLDTLIAVRDTVEDALKEMRSSKAA